MNDGSSYSRILFAVHRSIGSTEINGLVRELRDTGSGTYRLIVHFQAVGLVVLREHFREQGVVKRATSADKGVIAARRSCAVGTFGRAIAAAGNQTNAKDCKQNPCCQGSLDLEGI